MSGFSEMIFDCHFSFTVLFSIVCIKATVHRTVQSVPGKFGEITQSHSLSFVLFLRFFCPFTSLSFFLLPVFIAFAGAMLTYNYNTLFIQLMSFNIR